MATPTASAAKHPQSSSQAAATPPVSTPFSNHPAFSPKGPRSVGPSPQHLKKSPANSNTISGYPSGSGGGHPTNSSFGMAGYDSPSAAMALGAGVGLGDLGLDGMGVGDGGMGGSVLGDISASRIEDDKKRKLQAIIDILKVQKGRVGIDSIGRVAKRLGLEIDKNKKQLMIAGSAVEVDVVLEGHEVKELMVDLHESAEMVSKHTQRAAAILLQDLQIGPDESSLTKTLDHFAANLERLANLDKLSTFPGLNCHEAIAGIYESLERLHVWDVNKLRGDDMVVQQNEESISRMAMCTKSGKPIMHTRNQIGLSLDYWQVKRHLPIKNNSKERRKVWGLMIDCAPMGSFIYSPARVSDKWISPDIFKATNEIFLPNSDGPVLDWLEPENTLLPSAEAPKSDATEGAAQPPGHKYADVMFMARFDPPVVVPYGIAVQIYGQIYGSTNTPLDVYQQSTFDGLLFRHSQGESMEPGEARSISQETLVSTFEKDRTKSTELHKNNLFIEKIDFGRTLTELPFSHPRQLVEMLPVLRQYTLLQTILSNTFGADAKHAAREDREGQMKNKRDEFADFMAQTSPVPARSPDLSLDISLSVQPHPRLQVVFPFSKRTANVTFDIKPNGVVEVVTQNIIKETKNTESSEKGKTLRQQDLGRMLEITENLGTWVAYMRRRLG